MIFSGLNYAKWFSPIITFFLSLVKKVVNCCFCHVEWRDAINKMLDDVAMAEGVEEGQEQELREEEL